jgi:uncharacterized protein (DUF2062 family)
VSHDPVAVSPSPQRTFWQRRVRDPIVLQLTQGITPEKIALTVAIGSAIGLFPIIGTTSLLCFLIGWALKLNQPLIQLINQAMWPVHVPIIFVCVWVGQFLFNAPHAHFSIRYMNELLRNHPSLFFEKFGMTALHAVVGWTVMAPFYVAIIYYLSLPIMRSVTRLKTEVAAKVVAENPPEHPIP